jgi:hypothetical protein
MRAGLTRILYHNCSVLPAVLSRLFLYRNARFKRQRGGTTSLKIQTSESFFPIKKLAPVKTGAATKTKTFIRSLIEIVPGIAQDRQGKFLCK